MADPDRVPDALAVSVWLGVREALAVKLDVRDGLALWLGVLPPEGVEVPVTDGVMLGVGEHAERWPKRLTPAQVASGVHTVPLGETAAETGLASPAAGMPPAPFTMS